MIRQIGCVAAVGFAFATMLAAQTPAGQPEISFKFERAVPGVAVPRYMIRINEDGTGSYHAEALVAHSDAQVIDHPLVFTPGTVKTVFEGLHAIQSTNMLCASKAKNIADTGTKTLAYRDAGAEGSCTYNYSENKAVVQLTTIFLGIETTLEAGRALAFKHRFDRLGLDAEMASLTSEVEQGSALELGNILPTLQSIAGDTELIQRVRLRATRLLQQAQAQR